MKIEKWKFISSKNILKHPRMHLIEDTVELPNGNAVEYLRIAPVSRHSIAVIAINDKKQILLQKEYSYPTDEVLWQLPGGGQNDKETVTEAANRELAEESGYSAKNAQVMGYFYTNNRRSNERQYVVLLTDLFENKLKEDDEEFIESTWLDIDTIHKMIDKSELHNINLLAALALYLNKSW